MKNSAVRAVFAAAVVAGCGSAWADVPASAYVQDGLVAQFDGIENAKDASGKVVHSDADGTKWLDLVSGEPVNLYKSATSTPTIGANYYAFAGTGDCFAATLNGFTDQIAVTGGFTVELVSEYSTLSNLGIGARIGGEGFYYQGSCLTYTHLTGQCGNWQSIKANTFNSAAVTYTSDAAAAGVKSYLNGALSTGSTKVTWSAAYNPGNELKVGNHSASHAAVGKIYSARFYNRILSASEVAINAVVDRARFKGTWDDGYRWNAKTGKVEVRTRVKAIGSGKVAVGDENAASFFELWTVSGTELRIAVTPDEGVPFLGWQGGEPAATETPGVYSYTVGTAAELKAVMGGAERAWVGGTDNLWSTEVNWDPVGVPQAGERVSIPASKSVIVTEDMPKLATFDLAGTLTCSNWFTAVRADTVTVANGGKLTCGSAFASTEMSNRVWVVCRDFYLERGGTVDVNDKGYKAKNGPGYRGTGTYGGYGALGINSTLHLLPYGSASEPTDPGSGGNAGVAGGAVKIEANDGIAVINGAIKASSATRISFSNGNGNGSGGSVYISARRIQSSGGEIYACGGDSTSGWDYGETSSVASLPGGGGRIALSYDTTVQQDGDIAGMTLWAAAGRISRMFHSPGTCFLADAVIADKSYVEADAGTLWFSDARPLEGSFGTKMTGAIVHPTSFAFDSIDFTTGYVRFAADGGSVTVAGDVRVAGGRSRLDFGGATATNRSFGVELYTTRPWSLDVGGDFTVSGGARVDFRGAETNDTDEAGAYVNIAGAFTLEGTTNGYVTANDPIRGDNQIFRHYETSAYVWSDRINGGTPLLSVGSLTVESNALVSADRRGFGSGWAKYPDDPAMPINGFGPGGGRVVANPHYTYKACGGGYGGNGGLTDSSYCPGGRAYGDEYRPMLAGSGGSGRESVDKVANGFGGGFIHIKAKTTMRVDGTISANADDHGSNVVGGGSGGAILLECKSFSGAETGFLTAKGGNTGGAWNYLCGAGGGGRIAVWAGRSWTPKTRIRNCVVSDEPFVVEDVFSYLGKAEAKPGICSYHDSTVQTDGYEGTVRFVYYPGDPGLLLFVR